MPMTAKTLSRRGFVQILGAGAAAAALRPSLTEALLPAAKAATAAPAAPTVDGVVRLSSNENPYGPSPAAFDAMREGFRLAWRYPDEHVDALVADLAKLHGVGADHILAGDGSSEILKIAAAAFTSPGKPAVTADPTFEALARYASKGGAPVVKVPLTADYRHDVPALLKAAAGGGLIYVCNPNNPTATITPKAQVRDLIAQAPAGATVLVDEAYHHYADSGDYETVISLVHDHPNLIVARTFSKIHGMAGLRLGYAVAQPETLAHLRDQQAWDSLNILVVVAARASLQDTDHLEKSRRLNRETRDWLRSAVGGMGYKLLPSETNFLMIDLKTDVGPVIEALKGRRVEVGRRFAAMPECLRVTIGTRPQMEAFLGAFRQVMA
ncbi:MAG TPA: aminotransferase class I/II-fold pyridoxal phosphate-dependent enzyme [Thermoanaerobaculia bacterium]|jgi:histidinol-phosphate aminotransferase|nr:aminotransferase class I/II-fold pyridoxal phosphate-dependent enzyme [Thermoanaerobaculia bacterium]